jgi:outer membrane receptor for ferrienterochelin and colicin
MRRKCSIALLSFTLLFALTSYLHGGITGTISGTIRDRESDNLLPGAAVIVEGTTMGAMADKNGFYMIHNLPAGTYDVSVSMIGYSKLTIKNVKVNVDLNTDLNFYLTTKVLPMEEVVVTKSRELIQSEITSSTYFISGEEINQKLPIDSYLDAIQLLPGTVGNHIRGGRETDVLYMLDGLPIQGGLSREISSYFPNSSIVEMMVQTGGFTAEYGQASSGIVNVVTKDGRNKVAGGAKIYTDFFDTGLTGNDNTRRLEFNIGGPVTIGLGGPLINANYFISADLNLSDTPYREQMRKTFSSPIFKNYNLNSKLSFDIGSNTILTFQGLVSNWNWRRFDPQWELNLQGLAENKHYSHRLSASLTHTFTPKFFASLRTASYSYKRTVAGSLAEPQNNLVFENPEDPFSHILSGEQPWVEETRENIDVLKLDFVGQLSSKHLLKAGIDFQNYNLRSQADRLTPIPALDSTSISFLESRNDFSYSPKFLAFYLQDKIEVHGITANLGLRYDIFAPQISINEFPQEFQELRSLLRAPPSESRSPISNPVSPRLGVAVPLSDHERVHVNYGWYYQMPPLYYLYTNAEQQLNGYLPIIGNVDLKPIKTTSAEFSYKRLISDDLFFMFTGFVKQFKNLVDTQTFILPDTLRTSETSPVGFSRYSSSAFGKATGFEVSLQKRFTKKLSTRVSYTYLKANGTSSAAEDEFNRAIIGATPNEETKFPLSWDQRHSFILDADYETRQFHVNAFYRLFSPLPFTTPGSPVPNNARLSWRNILDIKVSIKSWRLLGGKLFPFLEIRNLFDEKNIINPTDDTGIYAYRLLDPINSNFGRRLRVGASLEF